MAGAVSTAKQERLGSNVPMKPKPWSYSALDKFINCPRQYYEVTVAKSVQDSQSHQMIEGNRVHKAFEKYVGLGSKLPDDLLDHKDYLDTLADRPGTTLVENKVALNKQLKPTGFFSKDVWFRGVIDYINMHKREAHIVDYKTGKQKDLLKQLASFALYTFYDAPNIEEIRTEFYWTKTQTTTGETWTRDQIPKMWGLFLPDLQQYKQAFNTDTWQPRPSGLCRGWCPVTECEHWEPKR